MGGSSNEFQRQQETDRLQRERADQEDLRKNWTAFCDADPFDGRDTFIERMEARGYIQIRPVKKADLEEPFAAERGIERGGYLWELTAAGHAVMDAPQPPVAGEGKR